MKTLTGNPLIEPESRMEKGKDVKFSIDDLKKASEPEGWDGTFFHLSSFRFSRRSASQFFLLKTDHGHRCS